MKLALSLPWGTNSTPTNFGYNPASNFSGDKGTLGNILTQFGEAALYIGATMMFFWAVWGVFDYLIAEGNKEALAKARKKIQWAIMGFIILLMAFFVSDYLASVVLTNKNLNAPQIEIK